MEKEYADSLIVSKDDQFGNVEELWDIMEKADEGFLVLNEDNDRKVEVTCMAGGRYLCYDPDEMPVAQTDNVSVAFNFLFDTPDPGDQRR